ncbi:DUF4381 domain-containing protein [Pseudomonas sp. NPDC086581]|uniref:DUF4381 domain-containing protein n=1 Tax=Pseudomonas sp. NPDC086581 TaxID=3364432 RepID=UPI0038092677
MASLAQLRELPLPAPPPYYPQTWGWLLLAALLGAALLGQLARRYRRWLHDAYRREALACLVYVERALPDDRTVLRELPALLKRVALSMPDASPAATLGGADWQALLQRCCPERLPADFAERLALLAYAPADYLEGLDAAQCATLLGQCRRWVESHHVAV